MSTLLSWRFPFRPGFTPRSSPFSMQTLAGSREERQVHTAPAAIHRASCFLSSCFQVKYPGWLKERPWLQCGRRLPPARSGSHPVTPEDVIPMG